MSKHTPGPWRAGRPDMATIVEGFESKYIYSEKRKYGYCRYNVCL